MLGFTDSLGDAQAEIVSVHQSTYDICEHGGIIGREVKSQIPAYLPQRFRRRANYWCAAPERFASRQAPAFQLARHDEGEGAFVELDEIGLVGIVDEDNLVLNAAKDGPRCISTQAFSVRAGDHQLR